MNALHQRARIARVRRLQYGFAAASAAKASGHVRMLESNDARLGQMRRGMEAEPGLTTGATLAARGELGTRFEAARQGLSLSINGARAAAALREKARIGARRDQESAEKLESKALHAARRTADEKMAAGFRPRVRTRTEGDPE